MASTCGVHFPNRFVVSPPGDPAQERPIAASAQRMPSGDGDSPADFPVRLAFPVHFLDLYWPRLVLERAIACLAAGRRRTVARRSRFISCRRYLYFSLPSVFTRVPGSTLPLAGKNHASSGSIRPQSPAGLVTGRAGFPAAMQTERSRPSCTTECAGNGLRLTPERASDQEAARRG